MTDSDSLMVISDDDENQEESESDDDQSRLYIDEHVLDCHIQQQTKSTNTGNPFELDLILFTEMNQYRTRSCQTILTSNTNLLFQRHRSTSCQAEYFQMFTQETNTTDDNDNQNDEEPPIRVTKRLKLSIT